MSTHDMNIANDTFPNVRADLNAALAAAASQQAGTADPATMYAYEVQARTDLGQTKRRNAANSGWVLAGTLAETYLIGRSSDTILAGANHKCTIVATGTFTQTLTAAATLGDGWEVYYRNDGSGVITLDPNSTEQIDGATTITLNPGDSCLIKCNGTGFKTIGRVDRKGAAKAWIKCNASGAIQASYNITSISDDGAGLLTTTLTNAFSGVNNIGVATALLNGGVRAINKSAASATAPSWICSNSADTPTDPNNWEIAMFGDQ